LLTKHLSSIALVLQWQLSSLWIS